MNPLTLFTNFWKRSRTTRPTPPRKNRARLSIEHLEDRLVPASLVVNSSLDFLNTPGTLRSAVNQANFDAARGISDTITFNTAAMGTNTITLKQGLLELRAGKGTVTMDGGGKIAISGNNKYEVLKVDYGAKAVLTGLVIENGHAVDGGGIYNDGSLTLANTTLKNNTASFGGGLLNDSSGNLAVSHCVFDHDSATSGGGLYNANGRMQVTNSTFNGNVAGWGGAILNSSFYALTLSGCNFNDNFAEYQGGAIVTEFGSLTVSSCRFSYDYTQNIGGAVCNFGTLTVSNSSFFANTATHGCALYNGKGGFLTVSNSSFVPYNASYAPFNIYNLGTEHLLGHNPGL
jgi:hypothetical protein